MVMDNDSKVRRVLKENQEYIRNFRNNMQGPTYSMNGISTEFNVSTDINTQTLETFFIPQNVPENVNDITSKFQIVTDSESYSDSNEHTDEDEISNELVKENKLVDIFQCEICGKVLSSKYNLNLHVKKHTGDRPFSCDICDKKFIKAEAVLIHKRIHTGKFSLSILIYLENCLKSFKKSNFY